MATMTTASGGTDALLGLYKRAPIELVRGEGVELFDADGRAYLDFTSGIAVNALGYGDPGLRDAMHAAADGLIHVSNLFRTAPGEQLAARLVEQSFATRCSSATRARKRTKARSSSRANGPRARWALRRRRSSRCAARSTGDCSRSLAATDRPSYRAPFRPLAGGVSIVERDIEDLAIVLDAETVAALILEPVQGEGGVRVLDHGFVREVRALTRERRCRADLRRDPVRPGSHGNVVRVRANRRRAGHARRWRSRSPAGFRWARS